MSIDMSATGRNHCTFSLLAMLKLWAWSGDKARNKPARRASEVRRAETMMSKLIDPSSCRESLRLALVFICWLEALSIRRRVDYQNDKAFLATSFSPRRRREACHL